MRLIGKLCVDFSALFTISLSIIYNLRVSNHMPPFGTRKGAAGTNSIGIGVRSVTENLKFVKSLTIASLTCRYPKRDPIQSVRE